MIKNYRVFFDAQQDRVRVAPMQEGEEIPYRMGTVDEKECDSFFITADYGLGDFEPFTTAYHLRDMRAKDGFAAHDIHAVVEKRLALTALQKDATSVHCLVDGKKRSVVIIPDVLKRNPYQIVTAISLIEKHYEPNSEAMFSNSKNWIVNFGGIVHDLVNLGVTEQQ